MRDFNEADRKKKSKRIRIQTNPANLSPKVLSRLEDAVKSALKDGCLSCPTAWQIAKEANVPRIAIGEITDRLGIRISNCQIGFFKVDKTPYDSSVHEDLDDQMNTILVGLNRDDQLTCAKVFDLTRQFNLKPIVLANAANVRGLKINACQLGCF